MVAIVKQLEMPDGHYLSAAAGWLGLGNAEEAQHELDHITPQMWTHPDVMRVRVEIYSKQQKWDRAAETVKVLRDASPGEAQLWLTLAYATRRMAGGSVESAKQILLDAYQRFPKEPVISYNLACYECVLGELPAARDWLARACAVGDRRVIRVMALSDSDLEPMWPEIRKKAI